MKNTELRIQITRKMTYPLLYELDLLAKEDECLSDEEIIAAAKAAASLGITKIRLTGGEPLEREGLEELIKSIKALDGIDTLSMTTTGIGLADRAVALKDAGLDSVDVRLDTFYQEKYIFLTGGGPIDAAMDGMEACVNLGLKPVRALNTVITGLNDDEILDFAQLSLNEPIEVVYVGKPDRGNINNSDKVEREMKFMAAEDVRKKFKGAVAVPEKDPLLESIKWFEARSKISFLSAERGLEFGAELLCDGSLKASLYDDEPTDISEAVKTCDAAVIAEKLSGI